jgi:hypothetical protein
MTKAITDKILLVVKVAVIITFNPSGSSKARSNGSTSS